MENSKSKSKKLFENVSAIVMTISILTALVSGGYGLLIWADTRYTSRATFTLLAVRVLVVTYDTRIDALSQREKFILEFQPDDTDELNFIRNQIKSVKYNRDLFLRSAHVPIGNTIRVNQAGLTPVFIQKE